jgi:hypothetical protein
MAEMITDNKRTVSVVSQKRDPSPLNVGDAGHPETR